MDCDAARNFKGIYRHINVLSSPLICVQLMADYYTAAVQSDMKMINCTSFSRQQTNKQELVCYARQLAHHLDQQSFRPLTLLAHPINDTPAVAIP
jgi:hypothetical protein